VIVERSDLPDAIILYIADLIEALGPAGARAKAAHHHKGAPAALRALSARRDMDDGLHHHVIIETVIAEADLARADILIEVLGDAGLTDEHACRIVGHGVIREELREIGPEALVEIVAVGVLQLLDRRHILGELDFGLQPVEAGVERGIVGGWSGYARTGGRHNKGGRSEPNSHEVPQARRR
jgi:hypothetical protein